MLQNKNRKMKVHHMQLMKSVFIPMVYMYCTLNLLIYVNDCFYLPHLKCSSTKNKQHYLQINELNFT